MHLTDLHDGRLRVNDRVIPSPPVRLRLSAYLTCRQQPSPNTANPHLFIHYRNANTTRPVTPYWIRKRLGMNAQPIRQDRILDEAHASSGDVRLICNLFGLSVAGAYRYTATVNHPGIADHIQMTRRGDANSTAVATFSSEDVSVAVTHTPWGTWDPLTPSEVSQLFAVLGAPWWLAGGYAIELAVGHRFREHADIDVLLLRRDQLIAQHALAGWEWWAADPPGVLRRWLPGETLSVGIHDIWCRPTADQPWRIQLMLDESSGEDWVSRRNPRLHQPISSLGCSSRDGIPHLAPEIQLFYKAKTPRLKDNADFAAVLPLLDTRQRNWLVHAITETYGTHPWPSQLTSTHPPRA